MTVNTWRTIAIGGTFLVLTIVLMVQYAEADAPVIVQYIPPIEMRDDDTFSVDLEDFDGGPVFEDPEGGDLTYGYMTNGDILVSIDGSVVTFQPAHGFAGIAIDVAIYAKDTNGYRSEKMLLFFTVMDFNIPVPTITAFEPFTTRVSTPEDKAITFRIFSLEDLGMHDWYIAWSVTGLEGSVLDSWEFSFPDLSDPEVVYNGSGVYTVRAGFYDRRCDNILDSITWTVTVRDVNRPPVITYLTGDQVLTHGDDVHLQVVAHDPDLDNISYQWYHSRDFVHVDKIGTYTKVVCSDDLGPGKHQFLCEVSDGDHTVVSRWINITITEIGTPRPSFPWDVATPILLAVPTSMAIMRSWKRGCS